MSIGDDAVVAGEVKKSKKKKNKSAKKSAKVEPLPVEAEPEQQAIEVDAPEKKKKRKREVNSEGEERKKKKRKRKDTADVPIIDGPITTTVEEKIAERQAAPEIDKKAERRKMKELRKQSKKQEKALAKAQASSSSRDPLKPAPSIKNIISTDEVENYLSENSITIHGHVVPVLDFDQLDIQPTLREVLNKFSKPTPIQACAWPALLEGKDVIGIAETGRFVPHS